jgi:hypothetical protein
MEEDNMHLPGLLRRINSLTRIALAACVVASGATALAAVPRASAEATYKCPSSEPECNFTNGPEEHINSATGTNWSGSGLCVDLWWHEGEYKEVKRECSSSATKEGAFENCVFWGHGETEKYYSYKYNLSGREFVETKIC